VDVGHQAAVEPRLEPFLDALQVRRRLVRRDHDLAALVDEGVEGVEELLLGGLLAADELDVVDQHDVDRAKLLLEVDGGLFAERADEAVHELLRRHVDHRARGLALADVPGDGVHQMGLAQPDAAVQEQRVERHRGRLGDAPGGGVGELVGFADHETIELVAVIQGRAQRVAVDGRRRVLGPFGAARRHRRAMVRLDDHLDGAEGGILAPPEDRQLFKVVIDHPVAHESRGNGKGYPAARDLAEGHGLEPALISGFADFRSQPPAYVRPLASLAVLGGRSLHPVHRPDAGALSTRRGGARLNRTQGLIPTRCGSYSGVGGDSDAASPKTPVFGASP
jgi:hypothetical protein